MERLLWKHKISKPFSTKHEPNPGIALALIQIRSALANNLLFQCQKMSTCESRRTSFIQVYWNTQGITSEK